MKPIISNERLISAIGSSLNEVLREVESEKAKHAGQLINVMLDELTLRCNLDFYISYLNEGLELLDSVSAKFPLACEKVVEQRGALATRSGEAKAGCVGYEDVAQQLESLKDLFGHVVKELVCDSSAEAAEVCASILEWEELESKRQAEFIREPEPEGSAEFDMQDFENYLKKFNTRYGSGAVKEFKPLLGGFQKRTVLCRIADKDSVESEVVVRAEQSDKFVEQDLGDVVEEYKVLQFAAAAGLPVATPLWCEANEEALGRRFLVTQKAKGRNFGDAVGSSDIPEESAIAMVSALAQIHSTPLEKFGDHIASTKLQRWLEMPSLASRTKKYVEESRGLADLRPHPSSPALEAAYHWLIDNVPEDEDTPRLLHGDYGPHNIMVDGSQVSAVLDWESAWIGDPAADLAFLKIGTAGRISEKNMLDWYCEAGGKPISQYRLRYYEVVSNLRYIVAVLAAAGLVSVDRTARNQWMLMPMKWRFAAMTGLMNKIKAANLAKS